TICESVKPRNRHHWLLRMREVGIAPVWGRGALGRVQKPRVLLNRDLGCRHGKGIQPDAMNRAFRGLTAVGSHEEPVSGDVNPEWLSDRHARGHTSDETFSFHISSRIGEIFHCVDHAGIHFIRRTRFTLWRACLKLKCLERCIEAGPARRGTHESNLYRSLR